MTAFAPSEDSYQPVHPRSLIIDFAGHSVGSQGSKVYSGGQRRLRQPAWMRRLIWVFAGRTSLIVGFLVRWLICFLLLVRSASPSIAACFAFCFSTVLHFVFIFGATLGGKGEDWAIVKPIYSSSSFCCSASLLKLCFEKVGLYWFCHVRSWFRDSVIPCLRHSVIA